MQNIIEQVMSNDYDKQSKMYIRFINQYDREKLKGKLSNAIQYFFDELFYEWDLDSSFLNIDVVADQTILSSRDFQKYLYELNKKKYLNGICYEDYRFESCIEYIRLFKYEIDQGYKNHNYKNSKFYEINKVITNSWIRFLKINKQLK